MFLLCLITRSMPPRNAVCRLKHRLDAVYNNLNTDRHAAVCVVLIQ